MSLRTDWLHDFVVRFHSTPLSVESPLAALALLTRLRELAKLRGTAAASRGVYSTRFAGWDLSEHADGITLRAAPPTAALVRQLAVTATATRAHLH
jgi:hypothetical protein